MISALSRDAIRNNELTHLLVGESHPLVDLGLLLLVGREDGLVGAELGDYPFVSALCSSPDSTSTRGQVEDSWRKDVLNQILRYHSRFILDICLLRQG